MSVTTRTMTTYRRADGEPIYEYDFVLDTEYFEDDDEPLQLVKEVWVLRGGETFWHLPSMRWQCCSNLECDEGADGWVDDADGKPVAFCSVHMAEQP